MELRSRYEPFQDKIHCLAARHMRCRITPFVMKLLFPRFSVSRFSHLLEMPTVNKSRFE